jgi:poly(3-hydroxybutyrate) depolymerase
MDQIVSSAAESTRGRLRHVEARTHGRYLVAAPGGAGPWPLLIGFHGYGEQAAIHLDALLRIPGVDGWLVAAVQALHPFYTRDQRVVANWMTREDRELAIDDNLDYVSRVVAAIRAEFPAGRPRVFAGFSQGGAMAYRAAAKLGADAVIVLAADVPPDLDADGVRLPHVLLGRGSRDQWYTPEKYAADLEVLARRASRVTGCVFDGGHEWTDAFHASAGALLAELQSSR